MSYTINKTQYDYDPKAYGNNTFATASVSITRHENTSTYERVCIVLCTRHGDIQTVWLRQMEDDDVKAEVDKAARTLLERYRKETTTVYVACLKEHAVRDVQYDTGYMSNLMDYEAWNDYPAARIFISLFATHTEQEAKELAAQFAQTDARNIEVIPVRTNH